MPLKRIRDIRTELPEDWVEEPARHKPEKIPFTFQFEKDIYLRLKSFVETKAKRHESMAYLINRAVEFYLNKLEQER